MRMVNDRGSYHIPKNFQDGITIPLIDVTMSYGTFAQAAILGIIGFLIGFNIPISWKYRWFILLVLAVGGFACGSIKINGGSLFQCLKAISFWKANRTESIYNPRIRWAATQKSFQGSNFDLKLAIPLEIHEQLDTKYMDDKILRDKVTNQVAELEANDQYFSDDDYKPFEYYTKSEYEAYEKEIKKELKRAKKLQKQGVKSGGKASKKTKAKEKGAKQKKSSKKQKR